MIEIFRNLSNNWIAKVLLAIIALSFVVVGGVGSSSSSINTVANVGDEKISYTEFYSDYRQSVQRLGQSVSQEQLKQYNFASTVLQRIIDRKLIEAEIKDITLKISNEAVAKEIQSQEYFHTDNTFNLQKFKNVLTSNNLTEDKYVALVTKDLEAQKYTSILNVMDFTPTYLEKRVSEHKTQKRSGYVATKSTAGIALKKPTAKEMLNYYALNKQKFIRPELRNVRVIQINEDTVQAPSEKQIKAFYSVNKKKYINLKEYTYYNISEEEDILSKIKDMLKKGNSIKKAIKTILDEDPEEYLIEGANKDNTESSIYKILKNTKVKSASKIFDAPLGKTIIWVESEKAENQKKFNDVKESIKKTLIAQNVYDVIETAEDMVSAGDILPDIASSLKLKISTFKNLTAKGLKSGIASNKIFLEEIFNTPEGQITETGETSDGKFFVASIDTVYEPKVPALKDITLLVLNAVNAQKLNTIVNDNLLEISKETTLSGFKSKAEKLGFTISQQKNIEFDEEKVIVKALFSAVKNTVSTTTEKEEGYAVFTTEVKIPKKISKDVTEKTHDMFKAFASQSLYQSMLQQLRKKHPVEINTTALNRVYGQGQAS